MARFDINAPITTREPTVTVDAGLPIGRHRFRLEVIGGRDRRSAPHDAIIDVQRLVIDTRPPVLPPIGPIPPVIGGAPPIGIARPSGTATPRRSRPGRKRKKEKP